MHEDPDNIHDPDPDPDPDPVQTRRNIDLVIDRSEVMGVTTV